MAGIASDYRACWHASCPSYSAVQSKQDCNILPGRRGVATLRIMLLAGVILVEYLALAQAKNFTCADLQGGGDLSTNCIISQTIMLENPSYISGVGNLTLLPSAALNCSKPDCEVTIMMGEVLHLDKNSAILGGTVLIEARHILLAEGSVISAQGLGGEPPPQTSGTPTGGEGSGGGHGGRGASCIANTDSGDVWGGDAYAWSTLDSPWKSGSRGGGLGSEEGGGAGGGRVSVTSRGTLSLNGSINANGASGGSTGGGGSGGSVIAVALEIEGTGQGVLSANGGDGHAGGGGGRVSLNATAMRGDFHILSHGGQSLGCPTNAGAAGTIFDVLLQQLNISNSYKGTETSTPLFEFPSYPLWGDFIVECDARVVALSKQLRVKVQKVVMLREGAVFNFGNAGQGWAELEVEADALFISSAKLQVYGVLRLTVAELALDNGALDIHCWALPFGLATTSTLDANRVDLTGGSNVTSTGILEIKGQGKLSVGGTDMVLAEKLFVSLFFWMGVEEGGLLQAPGVLPFSNDTRSRMNCNETKCPASVVASLEDCRIDENSPVTLQICRVYDLVLDGMVKGSTLHIDVFNTIFIGARGFFSASELGCEAGSGPGAGGSSKEGASGGGGHGGAGGQGMYLTDVTPGGLAYGSLKLPCELGSGSGLSGSGEGSSGGGVLGSGGGSGGSILIFLEKLRLVDGAKVAALGGRGSTAGGGGGGGGRIHLEWANIPTGDAYVPRANVSGGLESFFVIK
eukprot:jgi/Mesen1/5221/ME000026S04529